ncbi:HisA/HisF-related TIM barrel protein [Ferrovibrio sp.]
MVRSQGFSMHQYIGDPVSHVERMMQWDVDELIVLDIGDGEMSFEHQRTDYRTKPVATMLDFIDLIAVQCQMPLTFGGRIRTVDDIRQRIRHGADKVAVNSLLAEAPATVHEAATIFGSQAIVASIDYRIVDGVAKVFAGGRRAVDADAVSWARRAADHGVGEILLNAMDRDGTATGYDLGVINAVAEAVEIPVIACGGAGHQRHFLDVYQKTAASAAAAGNIYHFKENAYPLAKEFLKRQLPDIR